MQLENLFDATSALIVVGGTCLATVLRCGLGDIRAAFRAVANLGAKRFDAAQARAELAVHVRSMCRDGVIRTDPHHFGDAEFDAATDALIGTRSVSALHDAHLAHKRVRSDTNMRATRTLDQAADLAPVFGLAGTLVSLSQLPGADGGGDFAAAISMAVLTTLYGLLLGNIVFAPLERMVARRAVEEERDRQEVLDWLGRQVAEALPVALSSRADTVSVVRKRASAAGHSR